MHFLDYIDYCELIVEVMGYCARGYGLWKRKEYVHEKHLIIHRSQMHVICPNVWNKFHEMIRITLCKKSTL